jgi:hypothetical protein
LIRLLGFTVPAIMISRKWIEGAQHVPSCTELRISISVKSTNVSSN